LTFANNRTSPISPELEMEFAGGMKKKEGCDFPEGVMGREMQVNT
jgi:hypothetical protein